MVLLREVEVPGGAEVPSPGDDNAPAVAGVRKVVHRLGVVI
jgi:hypothetical protein